MQIFDIDIDIGIFLGGAHQSDLQPSNLLLSNLRYIFSH